MKIVMSIDEYKRYKNGKLNLFELKLNNMGINKDTAVNWIVENKTLLLNVAFLGLLVSNIPDAETFPMPENLDIIVNNISRLVEHAYRTPNPKEVIDSFFKFGWGNVSAISILKYYC